MIKNKIIIFTKIISVIIILNFITHQFTNSGKPNFVLSSSIEFILLILLTFPLFYYSFYLNKNKKIKLWARVITFVYLPIVFLTFYFLGNFKDIENLMGIFIHLLTFIGVYYYAWINKK